MRYVHGLKFEQLQQAIASSNANSPTGHLVLGTSNRFVQLKPAIVHISGVVDPQRLVTWIRIRIRIKIHKLDPEPDPDPHQFADVNQKRLECELI